MWSITLAEEMEEGKSSWEMARGKENEFKKKLEKFPGVRIRPRKDGRFRWQVSSFLIHTCPRGMRGQASGVVKFGKNLPKGQWQTATVFV